jgi:hypothetical protein
MEEPGEVKKEINEQRQSPERSHGGRSPKGSGLDASMSIGIHDGPCRSSFQLRDMRKFLDLKVELES